MCQAEIIHIFVKRLRARPIEVLARVGAVGPYALCEVGEAQFRVEIDALLGEEHPQAFAETVDVLRGGRSGFGLFCRHFRNDGLMPTDGVEHILLTVYEEADHQPAGERTEHVGVLHQRHRVLATEHPHEEQQEEHDGDATEPVQIDILVVGVLFLEAAVIGGNLDERPDCAEQSRGKGQIDTEHEYQFHLRDDVKQREHDERHDDEEGTANRKPTGTAQLEHDKAIERHRHEIEACSSIIGNAVGNLRVAEEKRGPSHIASR